MMPMRGAAILLPAGKQAVKVDIVADKRLTLGTYKVQPAPAQVPISYQGPVSPARPKAEVYAQTTPYPGRLSSETRLQWKSGCAILLTSLFPVQYIPATGEVSYYPNLTLVVKLSAVGAPASPYRPSAIDLRLIRLMVDNPDTADSYVEQPPARGASRLLGGTYNHVIITSGALSGSFQPLVNWRCATGLTSTVVTMENIRAAYQGRDDAEKVRAFISDARQNNGTAYVLLGGDADGKALGGESGPPVVPARGLWAAGDDESPPNIPADLYYACLDGSYDSDGDGAYGEPHDGEDGGEVDLLAEVFVGRAPVDSAAEAARFVAKTVAYESTSLGNPYLAKAWMIGEQLTGSDDCAAEVAAAAQSDAQASGLLESVRQFRDCCLDPAYVDLYYSWSPTVKRALLANPAMLCSAGRLLLKYAPSLKDLTRGGTGLTLTDADAAELAGFVAGVRAGIELVGTTGDLDRAEFTAELDELEQYLRTVGGRDVGAAFAASLYAKSNGEAQRAPALSGTTWGDDYKDEVRYGSSNYGYVTVGFPPAYSVQTLYDHNYTGGWSTSQLITILNSGPHLLNHMGHANTTTVMKMEITDVDSLQNSVPFFFFSQGCYAGAFDNRSTPGKGYLTQDCIAEHFVTGPRGAFACVVNSRYGWFMRGSTDGATQRYDRQFWDAVFGDELPWLGVALQMAKEDNIDYLVAGDQTMRFCYYELNLLGDPATAVALPLTGRNIAVNSLLVDPWIVQPQGDVNISIKIANLGLTIVSNLTATISIDGKKYQVVPIAQLAPGEVVDLIATWKATNAGKHVIGARVAGKSRDDRPGDDVRSTALYVSDLLAVDDDRRECPQARFTDIQTALYAALPGDTLEVYPGTYGPFVVGSSTPFLDIVGIGFPLVRAPGGTRDAVSIEAEGTKLQRLRITGSTTGSGIALKSPKNQITGNYVWGNDYGITIGHHQAIIVGNTFRENTIGVIIGSETRGNDVSANDIEDNDYGVYIPAPSETTGLAGTPSPSSVNAPNVFYLNNIGNRTDVCNEVEDEVCLWYSPDVEAGNYWTVADYEEDPHPLGARYEDTGTVTGRVSLQGTSSYPPVRVQVAGSDLATMSLSNGSFTLFDLPVGACRLTFSCPGWGSKSVTAVVDLGDTDIGTVTLPAPIKRVWAVINAQTVGSAPIKLEVGSTVTIEVWAEYAFPKGAVARLDCSALQWQVTGPVSFNPTTGMLTAGAAGNGEVKGTVEGKTLTIKVQVIPRLVGIAFSPADLSRIDIFTGKAQSPPKVLGQYEDGTKTDVTGLVTWTMGDPAVVQLIKGKLKGIQKGASSLSAAYRGFTTDSIEVRVWPPLKKVVADVTAVTVTPGQTGQVTLVATYADGSTSDVTLVATWTTSNARVATVNRGRIQGVAPGSTTVKASYGGKTVTIKVTVPRLTG
jgi:hypothetical protein